VQYLTKFQLTYQQHVTSHLSATAEFLALDTVAPEQDNAFAAG